MPNYQIRNWDLGDEDMEIVIKQNGVLFVIHVSPVNFRNSPSATRNFHKFYNMIDSGDDQRPEVWDYVEWTIDPFVAPFDTIAPKVSHVGKLTLKDIVTKKAYKCVLGVVDEKPTVDCITERTENAGLESDGKATAVRSLQSPFPIITLADVEVPYDGSSNIFKLAPHRVFVNGRQYFYKAAFAASIAADEVSKFTKIANSGLSTEELRVVRLYGIIEDSSGFIHGLLYEWIDADQALSWAVLEPATTKIMKGKWATQVKETVASLHNLGVIWGDVNAHNVLIDRGQNAVVIGLEGGLTRGWLDEDDYGTMEGDLQGVENIMDYIFNDECPLRPSNSSDDELGDRMED